MAIRMSGMISGLDTDAMVEELMSAQTLKKTKIEQNKEKLEWKQEKWEEMNTKVYSLYTEKLTSLKLQGTYLTKKATSSNEDKATASVTNGANGVYTLTVDNMATAQFVTGASLSDKELKKTSLLTEAGMSQGQTITIKTGKELDEETTFDVDADSTINDLLSKLDSAGLNASFDEDSGRFYISAKDSGSDNKFTIESDNDSSDGLEALGLENITETMATNGQTAADSSTMAVVAAQNLKAVLNGATIDQASNKINAAGVSIDVVGTTGAGEQINITVGNDVDAVYDKVKEFFTSYNELMTEMYEKYNADSARDYDMLTDDDKESMSDTQIELWENKIKDSLLRHDMTLNSLMSTFRSSMQETVEVDGETYSLASYNIVTGTYTEHGLLHIYGNADDSEYADKEDGLKKALEEDPETTGKVLSKIMDKLYSSLTDKMSASTISSALTFYNDKQIKSEIDDYQEQIDDWETRLEDLEERYYKQFSNMESAMAELQSQQSQLSGLLGTSS